MTTTATPEVTQPGCGPDCIYLDGYCRCHHGENVSGDVRLNDLDAPY